MSSHFCPAYPTPRKGRTSALAMFLGARRSWIDALSERAYSMHMGEVHLPGVDLYMVNEPPLVRRVMADEATGFPKSERLHEALQPLLGDSIFTTNGATWERQRRMMDPAFSQARVNVAFPAMLAATRDLLDRLCAHADGAKLDFELEMTHVTADIIFRTIFSEPITADDARRVFEAFSRYQAMAPRLMLPALFGARGFAWPWDRWRSRRAANDIRSVLEAMVRPRYEAHRAGRPQPTDILASFLEARDPAGGQPFSFEELVDQVAMLFLAGHETSASALTWSLHLLSHSPEVQQRMHDEWVAQVGEREPDPSDIRALRETWQVFRETLRLFPPVGFIARQSAQPCTMRDKSVTPGATVVVAPWLMHRHRRWWRDPDAFDPARFDDEQTRESMKQAYLPFGMGPRVCLGAAFAQQEAALILASLVRHYRFEPVPGHVPEPVGRLTIRPANGMPLVLRRREAA